MFEIENQDQQDRKLAEQLGFAEYDQFQLVTMLSAVQITLDTVKAVKNKTLLQVFLKVFSQKSDQQQQLIEQTNRKLKNMYYFSLTGQLTKQSYMKVCKNIPEILKEDQELQTLINQVIKQDLKGLNKAGFEGHFKELQTIPIKNQKIEEQIKKLRKEGVFEERGRARALESKKNQSKEAANQFLSKYHKANTFIKFLQIHYPKNYKKYILENKLYFSKAAAVLAQLAGGKDPDFVSFNRQFKGQGFSFEIFHMKDKQSYNEELSNLKKLCQNQIRGIKEQILQLNNQKKKGLREKLSICNAKVKQFQENMKYLSQIKEKWVRLPNCSRVQKLLFKGKSSLAQDQLKVVIVRSKDTPCAKKYILTLDRLSLTYQFSFGSQTSHQTSFKIKDLQVLMETTLSLTRMGTTLFFQTQDWTVKVPCNKLAEESIYSHEGNKTIINLQIRAPLSDPGLFKYKQLIFEMQPQLSFQDQDDFIRQTLKNNSNYTKERPAAKVQQKPIEAKKVQEKKQKKSQKPSQPKPQKKVQMKVEKKTVKPKIKTTIFIKELQLNYVIHKYHPINITCEGWSEKELAQLQTSVFSIEYNSFIQQFLNSVCNQLLTLEDLAQQEELVRSMIDSLVQKQVQLKKLQKQPEFKTEYVKLLNFFVEKDDRLYEQLEKDSPWRVFLQHRKTILLGELADKQ